MKNNLFTIRCAIKLNMYLINRIFAYQRFFLLKKWIKVRTNFFKFDSERASGIISIADTNQNLRNFIVVYVCILS
jgi:hypothetical protein